MAHLAVAWAWVVAHPVIVWSAVYVVLNVMPRPHPEGLTGWRLLLWGSIDRLCVFSAAKTPGAVKALFAATAGPAPAPPEPPRTEDSGSGTMVKP